MIQKGNVKQFIIMLVSGLLGIWSGLAWCGDGLEFPLREKYPGLSPIETDELVSIFSDAIIVDSRNEMEFKVVQMVGAYNILVGAMKEEDLLKLREKDSPAPIVFYCNGTTCTKSYKAAEKAVKMGFTNVRVYDPGIFFWAQKQPDKTKFFGQKLSAETVKTAFISKEKFDAVTLPTADFLAKTNDARYTLIDIRDPNERSENPIKLPKMKVLSFDTLVSQLEKGSNAVPKSGLLIFDNVGKQVDWVQYYLEKEGVIDYFFLKGGVDQWKKDGYDPSGKK